MIKAIHVRWIAGIVLIRISYAESELPVLWFDFTIEQKSQNQLLPKAE